MRKTRGRARLLFEMMHGGAIEKTWDNPAVEKAIDLCLSFKGCKREPLVLRSSSTK